MILSREREDECFTVGSSWDYELMKIKVKGISLNMISYNQNQVNAKAWNKNNNKKADYHNEKNLIAEKQKDHYIS